MFSKNSVTRFNLASVPQVFITGWQIVHVGVDLRRLQRRCRLLSRINLWMSVGVFVALVLLLSGFNFAQVPVGSKEWWLYNPILSFVLACYYWFISEVKSQEPCVVHMRYFIKSYRQIRFLLDHKWKYHDSYPTAGPGAAPDFSSVSSFVATKLVEDDLKVRDAELKDLHKGRSILDPNTTSAGLNQKHAINCDILRPFHFLAPRDGKVEMDLVHPPYDIGAL